MTQTQPLPPHPSEFRQPEVRHIPGVIQMRTACGERRSCSSTMPENLPAPVTCTSSIDTVVGRLSSTSMVALRGLLRSVTPPRRRGPADAATGGASAVATTAARARTPAAARRRRRVTTDTYSVLLPLRPAYSGALQWAVARPRTVPADVMTPAWMQSLYCCCGMDSFAPVVAVCTPC